MAHDRASRPEATPLRLFVAVDVPDDVRASLDAAVESYRRTVPEARWTKPEGWHVTLKFLGGTWPRRLEEVEAAVDAAAAAATPFESALTEIGTFPSRRRVRVVWEGVADPDGSLAGIARDLDTRLAEMFRPEKRALTPHLTLARLRIPANLDGNDLFDLDVISRPFEIAEVVLYRSHLSPKGATYEPIHRAPFGKSWRG